jgi:hypothetical protein
MGMCRSLYLLRIRYQMNAAKLLMQDAMSV